MRQTNADKVYRFILDYKVKNDGCAPSYREIMVSCGFSSLAYVDYLLRKLEDAGQIVRAGQRHIRVVGGQWQCMRRNA